MPINRTPSSSFGFLVKSKTFVVACLLSSAAMITEPQVAQARGGMNGFMAGAILGGAMRGMVPPGGRAYRGSRTYRGSRSGTSSRYGRSRSKPEKEIEAKDSGGEKVFGTSAVPAAAAGAAATGAAVTGASASGGGNSGGDGASSGGGSTAAASTGSSTGSETGGSSSRSSSRSGRSGSGGLQTIKGGLD